MKPLTEEIRLQIFHQNINNKVILNPRYGEKLILIKRSLSSLTDEEAKKYLNLLLWITIQQKILNIFMT